MHVILLIYLLFAPPYYYVEAFFRNFAAIIYVH